VSRGDVYFAAGAKETAMTTMRRVVVFVLLAVWSFPATSLAKPEPAPSPPLAARVGKTLPVGPADDAPSTEAASLAAREAASGPLQDFRGGGVVVYIGSGVLLVALIILIILLI
jgi:hypothetical protein